METYLPRDSTRLLANVSCGMDVTLTVRLNEIEATLIPPPVVPAHLPDPDDYNFVCAK